MQLDKVSLLLLMSLILAADMAVASGSLAGSKRRAGEPLPHRDDASTAGGAATPSGDRPIPAGERPAGGAAASSAGRPGVAPGGNAAAPQLRNQDYQY